jgi:hypothetical protein
MKCMFDGWYLWTGANEAKWTWYVTDTMTVYAKWLPFQDLTVTKNGVTFTLMDRNIWATESWTGCAMQDFQCYAGWQDMWYQNYNDCYQSCSGTGPLEKWGSSSTKWTTYGSNDSCAQQCTPILRGYETYEECNDAIEDDYYKCVLWWHSESDFWCSEWWSGHGYESYEDCYQDGINGGEIPEESESFCTINLHGYGDVDQCSEAMEDEYYQQASASMGVNWDYFQWWNNYWFKPNYSIAGWFVNGEAVVWEWAIDSDNHMSTYYNWKFITDNPWFDAEWDYYNLWWWDSYSDSDMQWPCPAWYHVPSESEWNSAVAAFNTNEIIFGKVWSSSPSSWVNDFRKTLKLPIAGYIDYQGWYYNNDPYYPLGAYWASTNNWGGSSQLLHLESSSASVYEFNTSYATSVRCFKNSATNLILETNGADSMMWDTGTEELSESTIYITWWVSKRWDTDDIWTLPEPVKSWHGFMWWYTTSWFEAWTKVTTNALLAPDGWDTVTVYAKWKECGEWYIIINNRYISETAWTVSTGGLIKVTNGEKTIYVKDRNVWATVSQGIPDIVIYQYLISLKAEELNNLYPDWNRSYSSSDYYQFNDQLCEYAEELIWIQFDYYQQVMNYLQNPLYYMILTYRDDIDVDDLMYQQQYWMWLTASEEAILLSIIESVTWIEFEWIDDAVDYVYDLEDNYNPLDPRFEETDIDSFGYYYQWWNDVWITYDELWLWECYNSYNGWWWWEMVAKSASSTKSASTKAISNDYNSSNFSCTINPSLDEGHEWFMSGANMDNEWWNEWSHDNPCDASKWEYLPTPQDWKDLMELWWDVNGYSTIQESNWNNLYYWFRDSSANLWFMNDMWIPLAWAADMYDWTWFGEASLWTAKDVDGYLGRYLSRYLGSFEISGWWGPKKSVKASSSSYQGAEWWLEYGAQDGEDMVVMPIRCFVRLPIITYDANGWTFSGWETTFSKQYTWDVTITEWVNPAKSWNTCDWKKCMFVGWYLWTGADAIEWTWYLKEDMTVYAKWLPFEDIDAYFISDTWAVSYITLMDRNMWAISDGVTSTGSYWFKYQWWNNHWFADGCWTENCSDDVTTQATTTKAIWDDSYDNSNYWWNTFIKTNSTPYD